MNNLLKGAFNAGLNNDYIDCELVNEATKYIQKLKDSGREISEKMEGELLAEYIKGFISSYSFNEE